MDACIFSNWVFPNFAKSHENKECGCGITDSVIKGLELLMT